MDRGAHLGLDQPLSSAGTRLRASRSQGGRVRPFAMIRLMLRRLKGVCTRKLADTAYLLPARASSIVLLPALAWGEGWNIIWGRARNVQGFRRRSRCDRRRRSGPIRATLEHAQSGRSDASPTAYGAPAIFSR